jgi:nickel/cobalt exporter
VILGVFVTLSHVSGIVLVGVLASLGSSWLVPARTEAILALIMGLLVVCLGLWMLWTQRGLIALSFPPPRARPLHAHDHAHAHHHHDHHHHHHARGRAGTGHHVHDHGDVGDREHDDAGGVGWHSHGWGTRHAHRIDLVTGERPRLAVLVTLSIAGGILPDPAALAILLAALSTGRVVLGLATVLVFSLGFAAALVAVGIVAAHVGRRVLGWLDSVWALRLQLATTLLIIGMGVWLTARAVGPFTLGASL